MLKKKLVVNVVMYIMWLTFYCFFNFKMNIHFNFGKNSIVMLLFISLRVKKEIY